MSVAAIPPERDTFTIGTSQASFRSRGAARTLLGSLPSVLCRLSVLRTILFFQETASIAIHA